MVKKASQISDLTKFSIYWYGGCYTLLDNLCFTLCYNNIMCKISDNTTIFSTSHWEKKFSPFIWVESHYLITLKYKCTSNKWMEIFWLEANCHLPRYLLDFGNSTFKMITSNHTIHIIEEQQIFTSLYNNVLLTIMSSQIENYYSYIFI